MLLGGGGKDFIQFLAALTILPRAILKNRMNSSFSFNSSWCQNIARAARNGIKCSPHTATTKFAFSYVFIILLCLDEAAEDGLEGHENHGLRALGGGLPAAVADGVLGLQGEEEAGREAVDLQDAGRPAGFGLFGWQIF